jgi:hypothetical protein
MMSEKDKSAAADSDSSLEWAKLWQTMAEHRSFCDGEAEVDRTALLAKSVLYFQLSR